MAKSKKGTYSPTGNSGTATATAPRPAATKTSQTTANPQAAVSTKSKTPTYEQVAQRAREIWTKKGCLPGQDEQNWLEAERQLKAELAGK